MATSSRSTERFKYGICLNDECPLCKEKKIQQIPMRKDLVCTNPECGKPLRECPPPSTGPNKKLIGIIAAAVLGVGAIGGGIYAWTHGKTEPTNPPKNIKAKLTLNHTSVDLKVGESDTLVATLTPTDVKATLIWQASEKSNAVEVTDGIVIAKAEGESEVQVNAVVGSDTLKAICAYKVGKQSSEPLPNPGKDSNSGKEPKPDKGRRPYNDLKPWASYATFDGTTMTFTKSHVIPGTNQIANPGDRVTGKWVDGEVNLVRWYHDGTSETLTHK